MRDFSADGFREACCIREYMMWSVVFSVSIEYISFDLQIYNLFPNSPTPHRFSFTPSSVAPSHRRTVAFIAIACRENQYCKTKRKIIKKYKILIINMLYNIIIYNNIIYFYSIVSFLPFPAPHVRIGLMRRCDGATVRRMSKAMSSEQGVMSSEQGAASN